MEVSRLNRAETGSPQRYDQPERSDAKPFSHGTGATWKCLVVFIRITTVWSHSNPMWIFYSYVWLRSVWQETVGNVVLYVARYWLQWKVLKGNKSIIVLFPQIAEEVFHFQEHAFQQKRKKNWQFTLLMQRLPRMMTWLHLCGLLAGSV